MSEMSYAIEINGLRKAFNDQEVVKGIDLKVKKENCLPCLVLTAPEKQLR